MMDFFMWFTKFENTKPVSLVLFFTMFCVILFYVFGNKERGAELETYKNIPLLDEDLDSKD